MFDVAAYLQNALDHNSLPHALLFIGQGGETHAKTLAIHLLKTTLQRLEAGNHPDYHLLAPEGKSGLYTIESIRHLIDRVFNAPFEANRKVFVLQDAERMQPAAANALLKTLEEPLLDTHLILLTHDARQILPTILSRCTQITLLSSQKIDTIDFSKLSEEIHRIEKELEAIEDPVLQSRRFDEFLAALMMWARDAHARQVGVPEEKLFFPHAHIPSVLPSIEKWEAALQKVRFAYQRNLKLSTCLAQVLHYIEK